MKRVREMFSLSSLNKKKIASLISCAMLVGTAAIGFAANDADNSSELRADEVTYNTKTGDMTATGNVFLRKGKSTATGARAVYNTKTSIGMITGGVVADSEKMHLTCDEVHMLSQTELFAQGNVHATKEDQSFVGPVVTYYSDQEYVRMDQGGTITTKDGSFTADYMEGWTRDEHAKGVGNAYIVSPPKNFEGGGDEAEYFGKENGKLVLTGNAWGIQDNNMLRSARLTVFLNEQGTAEAAPSTEAAPASEAAE